MKKISLDLDALEVETFAAEQPVEDVAGTVQAFQQSGGLGPQCESYDPNNAWCRISFVWDPNVPCTPVCQTGEAVCYTDPVYCG